MPLQISCHFDSGNIQVLSIDRPGNIRLAIKKDASSEFLQWFHFRLSGARGQSCTLNIVNAGETSYPAGWQNFDVVTSHDRQLWYRTPATFDGKTLSWSLTPEHDALWFAYFAPFSLEQHSNLIAATANCEGVKLERLGQTLDGRDFDCLHFAAVGDSDARGDGSNPSSETAENKPSTARSSRLQLWAIGRQHPGESMASWWMEGWLQRLADTSDAVSVALRAIADIHVVPNMNPDGSVRGHLRTNAAGINLNREWAEPSMQSSPEVFLVRQRMLDTGVDLNFDVHGDEALPYNFIAGTEGIANWNEIRNAELIAFKHTLAALNPDFQYAKGYPINRSGAANLSYCSNQIAHRFGCLAVTLEMPFKDTADTPHPDVGWSPERCRKLGASCVEAAWLALTKRMLTA
ncbi:MAG: M14-type cytosolic carboxypeptidase [Granulosicoccus sp.]